MANLTLLNNATTPTEIISGINYASEGLLGMGLAIVIFMAVLLALKSSGQDFADSFTAAAWVNMIVAFLLFFMSTNELTLIPMRYLIFSIVAAGSMLVYYVLQR